MSSRRRFTKEYEQEAVQNAWRHAAPRHIEIRAWTDADTVMLEVSDDHAGFDPEAARPSQRGKL